MDVYDILGYEYYSPLYKYGKLRWGSKTGEVLKKWKNRFAENVYEIGCGAGVWLAFLEEVLGVIATGVEINDKMIELWNVYKRLKGLKSEIVKCDARDFKERGTYIILDNTICYFSKEELFSILERAENFILEFNEIHDPVYLKYSYHFCGRKIEEEVIPLGKDCVKRIFKRGELKAELVQHLYTEDDFLDCSKEILKYGSRRFVYGSLRA